jgi:hypothetical protein
VLVGGHSTGTGYLFRFVILIFCVLIEKPAHTRQWAPSQLEGTGTQSWPLRLVGMIAETQPTVKLEGPGQGQGPVGAQSNSRHLLRLCPLHSPSESGHLTSQGLFPSCADVNQHICHTNLKACHNAGMGYREMPIQVRAGDVMAGGGPGGAAGPVQSIRHQAPGNLA